ncbi:putative neural-cadherin 2 [Bombina bombina]|uniref:putative neural-cadherin 2 n=1 Tax=Bombina bombina TaxID=8345 RepID=UPI00235A72DF|nr:putative neural-cadherin 2 [Bombina bombina]
MPTLKMGQETSILQLHFPKVVNVTDGKWHRIDVRIKAEEVHFMLDRCNSAVIYEAEGVGKKLLTEDRSSCEVTGLIQQDKRLWNTHPVLQLGGIKESTAHSYLHLPHKHFKGCLRNIILDKQLYDLEAPLESRNSLPGCFNNDMSCETTDWSSPPCELGTRCTGDSYLSNCACSPSHKGPECGRDVKEYFFQRDSFLHLLFPHALHNQRIFFQTLLRTRDANGIILSLTSLDKTEYIHLKVVDGLLTVSYNIGDGDFVIQLPGHRIDSGEWNMMILERMQNEFTLRLNEGGGQREITEARGMYKEIKVDPHNVILGSSKISFQGCMKDARLNNYRLPMENNTNSVVSIKSQHGVSEGCTSESCKSNPCSQPFICTDLWMMHKCSCPLGYILTDNSTGSHCIYTVCANSPCKHGTCVPRSPTEFICHCFAGYDGIKCDILHQTYDPELGFRTVFIICFCFLALTALIGGAFLWLHCRAKKKQHEGVYHVSAYNNELEDTRQNIFHYNEEGGGEEDHDAFNMTELQLSLQSSPADSLCRKTGMLNLNGPFSCNYEFCVSQKEPSQLSASKLNCSFTSGDFDRFFNDIAQDNAYIQEMLSRDSLKVYDMEGEGSPAGSLSTLASSGGDEDMVSEDMEDWGPKFGTLRKLYLYTEEDDL